MALIPQAPASDDQDQQDPTQGGDQQDGAPATQGGGPTPTQGGGTPTAQVGPTGGGILQQPANRPNTPEQDAYEKGVITVMEMLFERGAIENIIHAVIGSPNLGLSVAEQVFHVMNALDHHHGSSLPMPALVQITIDSLGIIGQMLQAAGRPMSGQDIVTAIQALITEYMKTAGSTSEQIQQTLSQIDPQQLSQLIDQQIGAGQGSQSSAPGAAPASGQGAEPDADDQGGDIAGPDGGDEDTSTDDSSGLSQLGTADDDDEDDEQATPAKGK